MSALRAAALIGLGAAACALWTKSGALSGGAPPPPRSAGPVVMSSTSAFSAPLRGMTISCPIYGQIWGTPAFSRAVEAIREIGGNWVAIHPYARIGTNGEVRFTEPEATGYLPGAVERARAGGVHLFWKPHLAYWGRFEWRGSIDFGADEDAWARFFSTYRAFILAHARFAAKNEIPLFAVGTELERMVDRESEWRAIIREIRAVYPGRLVWAANWDGVGRVPFWDALDYIGVQAYFPLELDGAALPEPEAVKRAWGRTLRDLEGLSRAHDRPVLFTEIGYPDAPHAARTPWKPGGMLSSAPELRARLVEVAARHLETVPFVEGMFWWKWMPGPHSGDFRMREPRMRRALAAAWKASLERGAPAKGASP